MSFFYLQHTILLPLAQSIDIGVGVLLGQGETSGQEHAKEHNNSAPSIMMMICIPTETHRTDNRKGGGFEIQLFH